MNLGISHLIERNKQPRTIYLNVEESPTNEYAESEIILGIYIYIYLYSNSAALK